MRDEYDWRLFAWAIDFIRGVESLSKFRRFLLRLVLGRYISREYVGLRDYLGETDYIDTRYDLEGCEYHREKWKWFR